MKHYANFFKHEHVSDAVPNGFDLPGDITLSKDNLVWSTPHWSDEFHVEFDITVTKEMPNSYYSVFHMTNSNDQGVGKRIPAVYVKSTENWIEICYHVSGNTNFCNGRLSNFQFHQLYHFEATQKYNSNGQAIYKVTANGNILVEVVNTQPMTFDDVKLYLSSPWTKSFANFGIVANLKIIDLKTPGKYQNNIF